MISRTCISPEATIEFGRSISADLGAGSIVSLEGGLGAGKTTLAKGIIEALGVSEIVTSPTFTIISEYTGRLPVYHLDLYRIEESEELYNLGIDDFLYGTGVALVEWIDRLPVLPERFTRVRIAVDPASGARDIQVLPAGQQEPV